MWPCECSDSDTGKAFTNEQTEMVTLTKSPLDWKDKAGQNHTPAFISTDLHGARGHCQGIHDFCVLSGFRHMDACNEVGGKGEGVTP